MDTRPNRKNKAAFSNFVGVEWVTSSCRRLVLLHSSMKLLFARIVTRVTSCANMLHKAELEATSRNMFS